MPRIPDDVLDCVIYLYPSMKAAEAGKSIGGSGFLASVPACGSDQHHVYAVTNWHVVDPAAPLGGNSPVIRLNTQRGDFEAIELKAADWTRHPAGDDLAIVKLDVNRDQHKFEHIGNDQFAGRIMERLAIGPGDDVFLVGRFINHEGKQKNTPAVRFGCISMMATEQVPHPNGQQVDAFLVEVKSISGFSGSPVFLWIPSDVRPVEVEGAMYPMVPQRYGPYLLGVHCGCLNAKHRIYKSDDDSEFNSLYALSNSGAAIVVPYWKLQEMLEMPEFANEREAIDKANRAAAAASPITLD